MRECELVHVDEIQCSTFVIRQFEVFIQYSCCALSLSFFFFFRVAMKVKWQWLKKYLIM